jgi:hypothetical protein
MSAKQTAISEFKKKPTDAYWARRVCEVNHDPSAQDQVLYARALACVASKDPSVIVEDSQLGVAHRLAVRAVPAEVLRSAERRIRIRNPSLSAHVKGKLWVAAMSGFKDANTLGELGGHARAHLVKVNDAERTATFRESYCIACAWSDYAELCANFDAYLAAAVYYRKHGALILVLDAAVRHKDWRTYDRYRLAYAHLPSDSARAHDDCMVLNMDGLRALAKKDLDEAQGVIRALIERGRNVAFLGGPDTLAFVKVLARKRLFPNESREYLRLAYGPSERIPPTFTNALRDLLSDPPNGRDARKATTPSRRRRHTRACRVAALRRLIRTVIPSRVACLTPWGDPARHMYPLRFAGALGTIRSAREDPPFAPRCLVALVGRQLR